MLHNQIVSTDFAYFSVTLLTYFHVKEFIVYFHELRVLYSQFNLCLSRWHRMMHLVLALELIWILAEELRNFAAYLLSSDVFTSTIALAYSLSIYILHDASIASPFAELAQMQVLCLLCMKKGHISY